MNDIMVFSLVGGALVGCAALGYYGALAAPGTRTRPILTFIAAWCLGTLFFGIPLYAVGWYYSKHRQRKGK